VHFVCFWHKADIPGPAEVLELARYSPLVRRKERDRIIGAASTTIGNIVTHETTHDNSQWVTNWLIVTNGKLAIPAAIRHVKPA
jgi:hypothetical protein